MASFGDSLRREREMRGVTLEEISATTKISVRLLEAIEREDFAKLPGGIFTRSFIRAYANYLGLDEERVMAEFQLVAPRSDLDLSRIGTNRSTPPQANSRQWMAPLAIAAVLLAGGYALFRYAHRTPEVQLTPAQTPPASPPGGSTGSPAGPTTNTAVQTGQPAAQEQQAEEPAPLQSQTQAAPGTEPGSAAVPVTGRANADAAQSSASVAMASDDLTLQLAATERSWVAVEADGKTVLQRILDPSDVRTLRAKNSFDVTTGNAQGIILTLNGETLKPLGRRGEVKKVHLTRDDLKNAGP
jgi:cytoskeleton protein RodZ